MQIDQARQIVRRYTVDDTFAYKEANTHDVIRALCVAVNYLLEQNHSRPSSTGDEPIEGEGPVVQLYGKDKGKIVRGTGLPTNRL